MQDNISFQEENNEVIAIGENTEAEAPTILEATDELIDKENDKKAQ